MREFSSVTFGPTVQLPPVGAKKLPVSKLSLNAIELVVRSKSVTAAPEPIKSNYNQQKDGTSDNFFFATPSWIDLPEEFSSGAFVEIEISRSEVEHLLFLEREQAGRKNDKNQ